MQLAVLLDLIAAQVPLKQIEPIPPNQITKVIIRQGLPDENTLAVDPANPALVIGCAGKAIVVARPRDTSAQNIVIRLLRIAGDQFLLSNDWRNQINKLALNAITSSIESILQQAAELAEQPLIILPMSGQTIIASSTPEVATGSALSRWLAGHEPSLDPTSFYKHVILTSPKDAPMPMLLTPLEFHGRALGYLGMPAVKRTIKGWQPQFLAMLAPLISSVAVKDQILDTVSTRDRLLDMLLNPEAESNLDISFAKQHTQLPQAMVLILCTSDGGDTLNNLKMRLEYLMTPMFSQVLGTVYRHRALFLVSLSLVEYHSKQFRTNLASAATRAGCHMVVSVFYTHTEDTLAALTVCMRTQALPTMPERVRYAGDEFFDLMLDQLPFSSSVLNFFIDPAVTALIDHDNQHGSEYFKTIHMYLHMSGNLTDTAAALYIHPNTLRKRMARIEEVTGIDPQNALTRFKLGAGIMLTDYLARLETEIH
ncbi:PucR family transcriptional regulator [Loigolactobacillus zhaoyuanensis]|uniref:PucR family transcriptional regulator n=1 Tax=Loigolactobacillus zhaoyuanensis TaxID=2486017 RepID=UPI000F747F8C|nr:PucR family transcriptional regulator [Loigolactobacillus zhaoyuanensis]